MKFIVVNAAFAGCIFALLSAPSLGADSSLKLHGDADLTLREMIERAEQNIIKADELIESRREAERKALRAAEVRKACNRAGILAESGDLAGAKAEWKRALTIVRDPEAKSRIIEQVRQAEVKTAAQRAERKLRIESLNAEGTALFERRLLDESQARFRESLILEASNPEARRYIESVIPAMRNELRLQAAREEDAKAAMEKGRSLFADGDLKGSVAKWREALRMTSDTERSAVISSEIGRAEERGGRASSCAAEGVSLFQSGDIQAAEAMFREALALDPMQLVAMDYLEVKVPARKVELHRLAVAEAEARAAFEKGNRFFAEGDAEGAGTAWREADAATRDPELKAAVAAQFRKAEERAAAERAAAEARLAALVRDGESLFQSDRLDEADAKFRNALALDPSNWSSHQHVDVNIPKRRQELERLALVEKNVAEVALRGEGFLKSGDLEGAKAAFLEAVVIAEKPESKGAMMEKVAQVTAAQQHRATELQTRIVALASEGEALYRTDSLQASEAKFKELVVLDASNLMATGYLNDTIPARKAELERRAVVAKQARAAYENGSRIAATGDLKGALDAWNEALDIVEEAGLAAAINAGIAEAKDKIAIAQGLCDEGAVLFKLGSLDRSASKYQEALAIDPMNLAAMDYLEVRLPAHRAELMRQRKNAEREARIAILVSEGESLFKADSLDVSAAKFKELLVLDASNSMATGYLNNSIPARKAELERREAVEKQVRAAYDEGAGKYSAGDLAGAIGAWEGALRIAEDAKLTAEISTSLQNARTKTARIQALHSESLSLFGSDSLNASEVKFRELLSLDAFNADAKEYLATRIPARRAELQRKAEAEVLARATYDRGNKLYEAGDYEGAKAAWRQALDIVQEQR